MWNASYAAVRTHLRRGAWYGEVNMHQATKPGALHFESLQAFWPALQVLAGDVDEAAESFASYYELWRRYRVLPERYDLQRHVVHPHAAAYPLRPELAESCYALYRATQSATYLRAGAAMVESLNSVARTEAGFASIKSVQTLDQEDHMTSFFLAETLKYLFLLFDDGNFLNVHAASFVLTTEGHLLPLKTVFSSVAPEHALPSAASLSSLGTVGLRHLIASAGLKHEDCLEKDELRSRARKAHTLLQQHSSQHVKVEEGARLKHDALVCGQTPLAETTTQHAHDAVHAREKNVVKAMGGDLIVRSSTRGIVASIAGGQGRLWVAAQQGDDPPALDNNKERTRLGETVVLRLAGGDRENDGDAYAEWEFEGHSESVTWRGPTHRLRLSRLDKDELSSIASWVPLQEPARGLDPQLPHTLLLVRARWCGEHVDVKTLQGAALLVRDCTAPLPTHPLHQAAQTAHALVVTESVACEAGGGPERSPGDDDHPLAWPSSAWPPPRGPPRLCEASDTVASPSAAALPAPALIVPPATHRELANAVTRELAELQLMVEPMSSVEAMRRLNQPLQGAELRAASPEYDELPGSLVLASSPSCRAPSCPPWQLVLHAPGEAC